MSRALPHAEPTAPWFLVQGGRYPGDEPFFFDPAQFPWVETLRRHKQVIAEELSALLARDESVLVPHFRRVMVHPPRSWKSIGFYHWRFREHRNCEACPRTTAVLDSIPHLTAASLSVLEPNSNINPHQGDTNAIVRAHMGLSVPAALPDCGLQVGSEIRPWVEGELLLFCDAHTHTAWNHTDQRRLVLIVDVMRPEYQHRTDAICARVMAAIQLQRIYQRLPWLERRSGRWHRVLHGVLSHLARMVLPLQRRFRWPRERPVRTPALPSEMGRG